MAVSKNKVYIGPVAENNEMKAPIPSDLKLMDALYISTKQMAFILIGKLTLYMRVCATASFISDQYNPNLIVNTTTNHPSNMNNNRGSTLSHTYQRICGVSHILSTLFGFLTFLWFLSHSDTIHYIFWTLNMNWYYNFIS